MLFMKNFASSVLVFCAFLRGLFLATNCAAPAQPSELPSALPLALPPTFFFKQGCFFAFAKNGQFL